MSNQIKTKKNQKIIGKMNYLNPTTNEYEEFTVVQESKETDFNFHKVWIKDLAALLDVIGGQKVKVLNHILVKMNSDNIYFGSTREIARALELSVQTVSSSLKLLKSSGQLKMLQDGVYMINPSLIIKGKSLKRQKLNAMFDRQSVKKTDEPKTDEPKTGVSKEERDYSVAQRAYEDKKFYEHQYKEFMENIKKMKAARAS